MILLLVIVIVLFIYTLVVKNVYYHTKIEVYNKNSVYI